MSLGWPCVIVLASTALLQLERAIVYITFKNLGLENGCHINVGWFALIQEAQTVSGLTATSPLECEERKVATDDRPRLELNTRVVTCLSIVKICKGQSYIQ